VFICFAATLFVARYGFELPFGSGAIPHVLSCTHTHFLTANFTFYRGEAWHRLRNEDFSQVDLDHHSQALVDLIQQMMRTDPTRRLTSAEVESYPPVCRARARMDVLHRELSAQEKNIWGASPLASAPSGFLEEILEADSMDTS